MYDPEKGTLDFRKARATAIKSNPRVILPKARTPKEEAEMLSRQTRAEEITADYLKAVGDKEESNMTPGEYRGWKKIRKRVEKKEVVVYQTDKSGLMAIATMESYERQGRRHVEDDIEVGWEEVND